MGKIIKIILRTCLPFALGLGILGWMYRGTDWEAFRACVMHDMKWSWMVLSLAFGILPQVARALRWNMALEPLGEHPRHRTCIDAIFLSYASSLVIPRSGEVTRCGTLKTYDGVSFTKSLGTVVTERLVDSLLMLLLSAAALLTQIPVFLRFLTATGTDFGQLPAHFSATGYLVTALCVVAAAFLSFVLLRRYSVFSKGKDLMRNLWEGIISLRKVRNFPLYLFYSLLIWAGYFLHFYIAFFCFDFTAGIRPEAALLIFCVGSFAVLVP
ncbi:MAG TPA: lysylphosphatidylglycerol synthase transmembrane domain-containing protein, partial [Alloprevotella sp.]|nr:lysylphosphatidylglycerol synthase transmembrane domain-containing protein [Alloprevotella sp.]